MVAALFLTSLRDNGRLAARFCSAPVLRLPVLLLWVAVFGGSLHAPCTTFFYLSVGASQEQVGNISAIISVVSMLTVPLYGHFIDATAGALEAVAAAGFCCALGCAVRAAALSVAWLYAGSLVLGFGAASLLPSVLSHLSSHCAPDEKRKVVAAVAFQTSLLRLDGQSRRCKMLNQYFDRCSLSRLCHDPECTRGTVGKSLYPPTVAVLAAAGASLELQYRVMMGVCPFFCVAGWVALSLRRKRSALAPVPPPPTPTSLAPAPELAPPLKQEVGAAKGGQSGGASWPPVFVATAAAIAATAAARQSGAVLWPLYLRDGFEWGAAQFAGALLAENLASIGALFFLPRVAQHYGAAAVAVGRAFAYLGVLSSLGTAVGSLATHLYAAHATAALLPAAVALASSALLLLPFQGALAPAPGVAADGKERCEAEWPEEGGGVDERAALLRTKATVRVFTE
ncbi:hypothetical protein EMIHUDRAFT_462617 [Emiliania huxleyi CCMP1516]|uniref:Major facilitator superfamily associated domain-containing protein n=2 Tax=Emiliania huxleyi TaxID=2903 RepID=A0A0D3KBK7_EMIH1|nr:hypothetical protein EMIHUDRAFT_462617 [Emiliania huxleyi CCMP1516]EOD33142.1 hypothetical protein EMIHUDRAFT_462617 [Emiliania huxleyi CCMP1516]|eukprot:XP_005785571.1 hypothetical protein EMIHUDRAFT_462617 [Emiliania huxleyi CCMP1516]